MNITSRRLRTPVRMTIKSRSPSTTLTQALHRCGLGRDDTRNNGMTSAIRGLHLQERTTTSGKRSATSGTLAVLAQASCLSFFLSFKSEECNGSCHTPLLRLHPRGGTRKLYLRSE